MTTPAPELLTVEEAAAILRVSPQTIRQYVARGYLADLRLPSRHRRFRRSDVEALLSEPKAVPTEAAS